jgi:hypothetical protein
LILRLVPIRHEKGQAQYHSDLRTNQAVCSVDVDGSPVVIRLSV